MNYPIENILAGMPVFARALPGIKFFEPIPEFFSWMADAYKDLEVFDIGAGMGHVARGLNLAGLRVKALDMIEREDAEFPVIHVNALRYTYPSDSVLMFCRPCHNGFVEGTIAHGLRCGAKHFLYVGLPKNSRTDLGRFRNRFQGACRKIGRDGETFYAMGEA